MIRVRRGVPILVLLPNQCTPITTQKSHLLRNSKYDGDCLVLHHQQQRSTMLERAASVGNVPRCSVEETGKMSTFNLSQNPISFGRKWIQCTPITITRKKQSSKRTFCVQHISCLSLLFITSILFKINDKQHPNICIASRYSFT